MYGWMGGRIDGWVDGIEAYQQIDRQTGRQVDRGTGTRTD